MAARKRHHGLLGAIPAEDSREGRLWRLNQSRSPFLRLPAEIRNQTYEYLLGGCRIHIAYQPWVHRWRQKDCRRYKEVTPGGFYTRILNDPRNPTSIPTKRRLTLLARVCRQLYKETALLPYRLNVWSFENYYVMKRYILREKRIPLLQRRAMRALLVGSDVTLTQTIERYLGGLEVLLVEHNGIIKLRKMERMNRASGWTIVKVNVSNTRIRLKIRVNAIWQPWPICQAAYISGSNTSAWTRRETM